ncbi:hypothetical protein RB599_000600 [Gaeumannomyces hyphopodioides]
MAKTWVARVRTEWMQLGGPLTELTFFQFPALLPLLQPGCGVRWAARQAYAHVCACMCVCVCMCVYVCMCVCMCERERERVLRVGVASASVLSSPLVPFNSSQHAWAPRTAQPDSPPRRYLKKQAAYLHPHGSDPLSGQETLPEGLQGGCGARWTGRGSGEIGSRAGRAGQGRHHVPRRYLIFRAAGAVMAQTREQTWANRIAEGGCEPGIGGVASLELIRAAKGQVGRREGEAWQRRAKG